MSFKNLLEQYSSKEYIDSLIAEFLQSKPLANGTHNAVTQLNGKVFLRSLDLIPTTPSAIREFTEEFNDNLMLNYNMLQDGINVVPLLGCFNYKGEFVEVQGKAPGDIVHSTNPSDVTTRFLTEHEQDLMRYVNLSPKAYERQLEYNLKMKQALVDAPQSFYDKFVADAKLLNSKHLQYLGDISAENVTFDCQKGFYFIDLDPYGDGYASILSDCNIMRQLSCLFDSINTYYACNSIAHHEQNTRSNKQVITKFFNAAINNNFKFSERDLEFVESFINDCCLEEDAKQIITNFKMQYLAKNKEFKK